MQIKRNIYGPDSAENQDSFEELISKNEDKILNLIYGMTGDYHLAQDLTQESFLKAFLSKQSFNGQAKFSTWLYRIAVNTTIDYKRKSCVRKENSSEEIENINNTTEPDPDNKCQKTAMKEILFKAISQLPDQQREIFTLREINGCSTKEVAEILSISNELVKWRLHKARTMLRKSLSNGNMYKNIGSFKLGPAGIE
ncbi:RNA polymerase sigma factor, sigma-70 family [Desulfosporosinus acidiphilus SJ4]|uniref:RNA polymerase sigma factor n=1 Tax=Desulfosporosinus acidiphilus (strain DSM 22704 / JCM 16185 / SJ4) TaxID=646529 RepID=I4D0W9_DESAJ|nr:RNA polymerase sigma factor [Desulfosporosinus acidiphilus]AFM39443.1 RNA polymerase sigma factor, sigma-70 family [Desulfosporosinus acidiphilus SJ4]